MRASVSEQRERIDSRRSHAPRTVLWVVAGRRVVCKHSRIFDRGNFIPVRGMCGAQGLSKLGNITEHIFRCQDHPRRYELVLGLSREIADEPEGEPFSVMFPNNDSASPFYVYMMVGSTMHFEPLEAS